MSKKKSPEEKEWELVLKKEARFLEGREKKTDSLLNQKIGGVIPEKLQGALDAAFIKAFDLIFDKGTKVIEKTYQKERLEQDYKINAYARELRKDRKSLRAFAKNAGRTGQAAFLMSGISGIGMGVLGIGLPDIPIFLGMAVKTVYETALHYGYSYDSEEERYFILLLIEASAARGEEALFASKEADGYIESGLLPAGYDRKEQIKKTASVLSRELLYMKFLQGIPVAGIVGGAFDAVYMRQIAAFAGIKYRKRFLSDQMGKKS